MSVGKRLKQARNKAGLTQRQVADAAKVSKMTISNLEREITRSPSSENLEPIAKAVNVTSHWLLSGDDSTITKEYLYDDTRADNVLRPYVEDDMHQFYIITNADNHECCILITWDVVTSSKEFGDSSYSESTVFYGFVKQAQINLVAQASRCFLVSVTNKTFAHLVSDGLSKERLYKEVVSKAKVARKEALGKIFSGCNTQSSSEHAMASVLGSSPKAQEISQVILRKSAEGTLPDAKIEAIATLLDYQPGKLAGMADKIKRG